MPKTHESDLEQHVLKHLKGLGYAYKPGESLDPAVAPLERPNYNAAILAAGLGHCQHGDLLPKIIVGELSVAAVSATMGAVL